MTAIHTFPRGETVVAMCTLDGRVVVATTNRVWMQDAEGVLVPVEIQADDAAPAESMVFTPGGSGA